MIPLRTHNVLDYVIGLVLMLCPWLFAFRDLSTATNLFMILGGGLIAYSLLTNYYYSIARVFPLGVHMAFDALAGLALILAPSVFGYRGMLTTGQEGLHYILGVGAVGLVLFTKPRTQQERSQLGARATSATYHHT